MAAIASRWLRRKSGRAARPAGDGSFRDIESEHLQLTVSVRSAPGGILGDHPEDERSELLAGRLAIETSTSGLVTFPHSPYGGSYDMLSFERRHLPACEIYTDYRLMCPSVLPMNAGQKLRAAREKLGLTIRDVETASARLAAKYRNDDYNLPLSRLSDIETKGITPSIYRLYALAVICRVSIEELFSWYEIDLTRTPADLTLTEPPKTHLLRIGFGKSEVQVPVRMDPSFEIRRTTNVGRMIEKWGAISFAYLQNLAGTSYAYGYIGTEDFTMYPLLLPGSFVQIDESRNKILEGMWRSEYERPVYFIETRDGYTCCWCALKEHQLVLQPHPLSPVQPRILKDQQEAEVLGRVVGVAMRLADWTPSPPSPPARVEKAP